MSETKKDPRPTKDAGQSRSSERIVTDGPSGLKRLEDAMRKILKVRKPRLDSGGPKADIK